MNAPTPSEPAGEPNPEAPLTEGASRSQAEDTDLRWVAGALARRKRERWLEQNFPEYRLIQVILGGPVPTIVLAGLIPLIAGTEFEHAPLALQVMLTVLAFALGALGLPLLLSRSSREKWPRLLNEGEGLYPISLALAFIVVMATFGFAALSALLYIRGVTTTSPANALDDPFWDSALSFYTWSFLDSVPVLDIPQTVRWEPGFEFSDHISPVLLLFYKIAVITPAIATGALIWKARQRGRRSSE